MVVAGSATSVCVVALNSVTASSASAATSTTAASTGLRDLFCHIQLDVHRLGYTRGQETGRCAPHVTLLYEGLEGGVQAPWAVVGEELEICVEVHKGYGGEGYRLG